MELFLWLIQPRVILGLHLIIAVVMFSLMYHASLNGRMDIDVPLSKKGLIIVLALVSLLWFIFIPMNLLKTKVEVEVEWDKNTRTGKVGTRVEKFIRDKAERRKSRK